MLVVICSVLRGYRGGQSGVTKARGRWRQDRGKADQAQERVGLVAVAQCIAYFPSQAQSADTGQCGLVLAI